jgi:hypothetical protein
VIQGSKYDAGRKRLNMREEMQVGEYQEEERGGDGCKYRSVRFVEETGRNNKGYGDQKDDRKQKRERQQANASN